MSEISVIVPIYNVEKYLSKCIMSILNQTFRDIELILIDDGSTDGCGRICDAYAKKDTRIRVIHQENGGLSAARNSGIKKAKSRYLTFIDSDDFIHEEMLEILYRLIEENQADMAVADYQIVYEDRDIPKVSMGNHIVTYSNIEGVKEIVEKSDFAMIPAWGKLYKTNLFEGIRYPISKYHEDEFVTYKLLYKANKIIGVDNKLYYYLQRGNSITGSPYNLKRLEKLEALEEAIRFFKEKDEAILERLAIYRYLLNIQIAYYRVRYEVDNNRDILMQLKAQFDNTYREYEVEGLKKIGIPKQMQLRLFYRHPRVYSYLVRCYIIISPKIKGE